MADRDFVFRQITNRKGRPIAVYIWQTESPDAKAYDGYYVDPVDNAKVEIEVGGQWNKGSGAPPHGAYEVKLTKVK